NYAKNKARTYKFLDSLYQKFASASKRRFELGETNYLEMISAQSKHKQLETLFKQSQQEVVLTREALKEVLQTDSVSVPDFTPQKLELKRASLENHVGISIYDNLNLYYETQNQKEKQNLLPDLSVEYFQGTNSALSGNIIGYQFGIKIPLFFSGNTSKIKATKIAKEAS